MPAEKWAGYAAAPSPLQRQSSGNGSLLATAVFWRTPPKSGFWILGNGKNTDFSSPIFQERKMGEVRQRIIGYLKT